MEIKYLYSVAVAYELLAKQADIKASMALRTLWNLLPALSTSFSNMVKEEDVLDYLALESLVDGAKELIKYGAVACVEELMQGYMNREKLAEVKKQLNKRNYIGVIQEAEAMFLDASQWDIFIYGGRVWARSASQLLKINNDLNKIEMAEGVKGKVKYINSLIANMNILEQLSHNTGSIIAKMREHQLAEEKGYKPLQKTPHKARLEAEQEKVRLEELMDVKEYDNPYDTLRAIMPYINEDPKAKQIYEDIVRSYRGFLPTEGPISDWRELENKRISLRRKRSLQLTLNSELGYPIDRLRLVQNNPEELRHELTTGTSFGNNLAFTLGSLATSLSMLKREESVKAMERLKRMYNSLDTGNIMKWEGAAPAELQQLARELNFVLTRAYKLVKEAL